MKISNGVKKIIIFITILLLAGLVLTISSTNVLAADKKWEEYREKVEACTETALIEKRESMQKFHEVRLPYSLHFAMAPAGRCWLDCDRIIREKYPEEDESFIYSKKVPCYNSCIQPYEEAYNQGLGRAKEEVKKLKEDWQGCLNEAGDWYEVVKEEDYSQFCTSPVHSERMEIFDIVGKWELEECEEKVEICNEKARSAREEFIKQGNEIYNQIWDYAGSCGEKCESKEPWNKEEFWNVVFPCELNCCKIEGLPSYKQDNEKIAQELKKIDEDWEACIGEVEDWYETIEEKVINNYFSRDISGEKIVFQVWGLEGNVYVKPKGQDEWYKLKKGYRLIEGDIVRTTKNGMIGFKDSRGTRIEMDTNTQIEMKELEEARRFYRVHAGITRFKVPKKGEAWQEIIIKTPTCLVGAYGTDFIVKVDETGNTSVFVLDGEVKVSDINNKETVVVKPGQVSGVKLNDTLSQPVEYENEEIKAMLDDLGVKEGISFYPWILVGLAILGIAIGGIIILIKKKKKK